MNTSWTIDTKVLDYLRQHSIREAGALQQLREETAKLPMAVMQIAPEQGAFMQLLVKLLNAKNTIEVGVFTGYSTLATALALPDDGKIVACDISEEWTSIGKIYWKQAGVAHKIDLHLRPATETLDQLIKAGKQNTFDFAFIDGDKVNYPNYYERCLTLLRKGGLLAIDNVLWDGRVAEDPASHDEDTRAIDSLNKKIAKDERVQISMLPLADGLTLAFKL
jgi:predicted O-methyltransferase YrrM